MIGTPPVSLNHNPLGLRSADTALVDDYAVAQWAAELEDR